MTIKSFVPYALRQKLKTAPGLLDIQFRTLHARSLSQLATVQTRLCLESFPRSGNGFAYTIIRDVLRIPSSQIAHHTHSTANIRRAVDRGLPTYVIVRDPHESCISLVAWGAANSFEDALQAYEDFHRDLLPWLPSLTIIRFEDLTGSPGAFVGHVANRLGEMSPGWSEETSATVENTIKQSDAERRVANFLRTSLPTDEKERRKREIAARSISTNIDERLLRCRALRDQLLERAAVLGGNS